MGKSLERRFEEYGEVIGETLAHADRRMPAQWYLRGLMLPGGRKSVEPMAAPTSTDGSAFINTVDLGCTAVA